MISQASKTIPSASAPDVEPAQTPRWLRVVGLLAGDVGIGVLLAVMIALVLLFSSGASKFVYIDF